MFHGNTLVTVFRGTVTDDYGDIQDVDTPVPGLQHLRMSIIEQSRRVYVPADNLDRIIRFTRGRTQSDVDIREGDRIKDEMADVTYVVEAVVNPGSPYSSGDVRLDLKRVS